MSPKPTPPTLRLGVQSRAKSQSVTTIQIIYTVARKPSYVSTQVQVDSRYWRSDLGQFVNRRDAHQSSMLNAQLADLLTRAQDAVSEAWAIGKVMSRAELQLALFPDISEGSMAAPASSITGLFNSYIAAHPTLTNGSVQAYRFAQGVLLDWLTLLDNPDLTAETLTAEGWANILTYMQLKNLKPNTQLHVYTLTRSCFNYGYKASIIKTTHHLLFTRPISKAVHTFALTQAEVTRLEEATVPDHLVAVRDAFVMQCGCGLRISDLRRITDEDIDLELNRINLREQKTGSIHTTFISPVMRSIIDHYNGMPPLPRYTAAYISQVRQCAQIAGLSRMVKVSDSVEGKLVDISKPVYEAITSHTARRTFVTRAAKKLDTPTAMRLSGHKSYAAFSKYVQLSTDDLQKSFNDI